MGTIESFRKHPTLPLAVSTEGTVINLNTGNALKPALVGGGSSGPSTGSRIRENRYLRIRLPKAAAEARGHKTAAVHSLVLETFVGPKPEGYDADHIDSTKTNNRLDNLRYLPEKVNRGRGSVARTSKGL